MHEAPPSPHPASPVEVSPPPGLVGAVERIDRSGVAGWCHHATDPETPLTLHIEVAGVAVACISPQVSRPDLSAGRTRPLLAGFEFHWVQAAPEAVGRLVERLRGSTGPETEVVAVRVLCTGSAAPVSQDWLAAQARPPLTRRHLLPLLERLTGGADPALAHHPAVVVTGMHRSGTSALAEALHGLGLWMGHAEEFWPPADRWNPNGYFELSWVVRINDHLLQQSGHAWNHPPADALAWPGEAPVLNWARQVARAVCAELKDDAAARQRQAWGFKDPRTLVLGEFWNEVLPQARWMLTIRHPLEVAHSLVRRDGMTLSAALALVETHFEHLDRLLARCPDRCVVVCYANFLVAPALLLGALARHGGMIAPRADVERAARSVSAVHHHHGLAHLAWPDGHAALRALYLKLRHLSLYPGSPAAAGTLTHAMNKTNSAINDLSAPPSHRGAAERLAVPTLSGWCFLGADPGQPVRLTVVCEGVVLGHARTGIARADISDKLGEPCQPGFALHWSELPASQRALLAETLEGTPERLQERVDLRLFIDETLELDTTWALAHGEPLTRQALLAHLQQLAAGPATRSVQARRDALLQQLPAVAGATAPSRIQPVAFYLPQFHPTPENDEWWGKGFTEWTCVTSGTPRFEGHDQPRRPSELGYYDLRTPGLMETQIALAQSHGVRAFCFHHYWMNGQRLLHGPLEQFLKLPHDLGFCLCWANEPWSRRWDGSDHEVLAAQTHDDASDIAFFQDVLPLLKDARCLKVDGLPLLVIYRADRISEPLRVFDRWRELAREAGLPGVHLAMAETFGLTDPRPLGCDSSVQFPPHNQRDLVERPATELQAGFRGKVFEYPQIVAHALNEAPVPHRRYPGVMLGWDNTARRGDDAHVYDHYEPGAFELWLEHAARSVEADRPAGERYVFINAWNEWSEGSYLEPDHRWGRAALEAVRAVVTGQATAATHLALLRHQLADQAPALASLDALETRLRGLQQSLDYSLYLSRSRHPHVLPSRVTADAPQGLASCRLAGKGRVERLGSSRVGGQGQIPRDQVLTLSGWALPGDRTLDDSTLSFVILKPLDAEPAQRRPWFGLVTRREARPDVAQSTGQAAEQGLWSGWSTELDLHGLPPGRYELSLAFPDDALGSGAPATEVSLRTRLEVLP